LYSPVGGSKHEAKPFCVIKGYNNLAYVARISETGELIRA